MKFVASDKQNDKSTASVRERKRRAASPAKSESKTKRPAPTTAQIILRGNIGLCFPIFNHFNDNVNLIVLLTIIPTICCSQSVQVRSLECGMSTVPQASTAYLLLRSRRSTARSMYALRQR